MTPRRRHPNRPPKRDCVTCGGAVYKWGEPVCDSCLADQRAERAGPGIRELLSLPPREPAGGPGAAAHDGIPY